MVKKIAYCLACILLTALNVFSQKSPNNIYPLLSTRKDVVKALGERNSEGINETTYNLEDNDITITFYKAGCSESIEKALEIARDTVLEVRIVPKARQKLLDTILDLSFYKRHNLPDGRFLYLNSKDGILVISKDEGSLEFTEKVYFLLPDLKIPKCLVNSFNSNSGLAILKSLGLMSPEEDIHSFPPIRLGGFFEEDSKSTKNSILDELSRKLLQHQNGVGYIVEYSTENDSSSTKLHRRNKLSDYLKKKGITCQRLVFVNGGNGELAGSYLAIVHKSFVVENKLKTLCN